MTIEGITHRPVIDHEKCNTCSICLKACPAEIMPEMRREGDSLRAKIYGGADNYIKINIEKAFGSPSCQDTCPLHQDVRGYVKLISKGQYREALELIRETNPLPSVCGYVCHHPCESACTRGFVDEPISIKSLKRFVAGYDDSHLRYPETGKAKKRKVCIVGSGPAGLTAAHELAKKGYEVEIIESYSEPGGMLVWAIPPFRLPREILKRDIEYIKKMGVTIKTGVYFGTDLTISDLKKAGAKAIIVATGTPVSLKMNIENESGFEGYVDCLMFLRKYVQHEEISLGDRVLVVGGGNAAIDSARSAARVGARNVTILYRRGPDEMPADRDEVKEALIEGIKIEFLTAPKRIIESGGKVKALECVRTELREAPDSKRPKPVAITGSEFTINADTIISAIGQEPDQTLRKTLGVDSEIMSTSKEGVFAAGDFVNGPTTVVEAMASGKKVARAVDMYLSKKSNL